MTVDEVRQDNKVQLAVHGKIDVNTSPEFQNILLRAFQKSPNVVIDMRDTEYISSAGLRVLVIGQKTASSKGGKMSIIGAGAELKDIFRVTGFDKFLTLQ